MNILYSVRIINNNDDNDKVNGPTVLHSNFRRPKITVKSTKYNLQNAATYN